MFDTQIYETILKYYLYVGRESGFSIFNINFLFTDIRIQLNHKTGNIRIIIMELVVYEGNYCNAPDLCPPNILREFHRQYNEQFAKFKSQWVYKLHTKALRIYKDGYTFEAFRKLHSFDTTTYTFQEHLLTHIEKNYITTYKVVVNMVNDKLGGNIQSHSIVIDNEGQIIGFDNNETYMLIYNVEVMHGLTHGQISDLFIKLDEGKDTIIMSRLMPHIRKRIINDFLSALDDDPPRPV